MNLLEKFAEQLKKDHHTADGLLVAVSGGADSVVLCDLCHKTNVNFMIAHCNFKLRGAESERDEAFVKALAAGYNKELFVSSFDTEAYAEANKISIQVAARELRYQWFRQLLHEGDAKWIVTAHHADDNIETVVMNFFRGTGLKGLAGMDVHFNGIYRPLLEIRKQEIVDYAKANNLQFVEDSSNANSYYTTPRATTN